ncbi:hypothetical protein D3C71_328650 [compost metagenome]
MNAETYFALEPLLLARLAGIPGLAVLSVTDADDKTLFNTIEPTAVVAFQGDVKKDGNDYALLMESRWSVSLFIRANGVKERGAEEGQLLLAVVRALHGWCPGEGFGSLELQGTDPESYDGGALREYALLFSVDTTLYTRGGR